MSYSAIHWTNQRSDLNIKLTSLSLAKRKQGFEEPIVEIVDDLSEEQWEELRASKINEWLQLKEAGVLDQLSNADLTEEDIEAVDRIADETVGRKRVLRRQRAIGVDVSVDEEENQQKRIRYKLTEKLKSLKGNAVALYSFFDELKQKDIRDVDLYEETLFSLSRLPSAVRQLRDAYATYIQRHEDGNFNNSTINEMNDNNYNLEAFTIDLIIKCFANNHSIAAEEIVRIAAEEHGIGGGREALEELVRPGRVCDAIYNAEDNVIEEELLQLYGSIRQYDIMYINQVLRALAKKRRLQDIFNLFTILRMERIKPNTESIEFLANAVVASIGKQQTAVSMQTLPTPAMQSPEIVFVGRSNVGKSSLVNFLLNRKALASTSATPGHTKKFHFFPVNEGRHDLPPFHLVDVPGIGYAETVDEGKQTSWKSLLMRYMSKREPLRLVCHLIDSRHKVTNADREMFEVMVRASVERYEEGIDPFTYAIILTKADRAAFKAIAASTNDIKEELNTILKVLSMSHDQQEASVINQKMKYAQSLRGMMDVTSTLPALQQQLESIPIIITSSSAKQGADDVWKLLQQVVTGSSYDEEIKALREKLQNHDAEKASSRTRKPAVDDVSDNLKRTTPRRLVTKRQKK